MNKEFTGNIRIFVRKIDAFDFEVGERKDIFDIGLISDISNEMHSKDIVKIEIQENGLELFEEDIKNVLGGYADDDVVEICAETKVEYIESGWEVIEYDSYGSLGNIQHRKLTPIQTKVFAPEFLLMQQK